MKLIQLPTQAFEQRLKEEMNENPALEGGKEEDINDDDYEKDEFDDYEEDEFDRIDAEDINIDEYLSNDETPELIGMLGRSMLLRAKNEHLIKRALQIREKIQVHIRLAT
jgi:DNA-directed RNA polymerase specialized sigma54-like protein